MSYNAIKNNPIVNTSPYLSYFRHEINTPYVVFRSANEYVVDEETGEVTYSPTYIYLNDTTSIFYCGLQFAQPGGNTGILIAHDKITFPDNTIASSFKLINLNDIELTDLRAGQMVIYNGYNFINSDRERSVGYALQLYLTATDIGIDSYKTIQSFPNVDPEVTAELSETPYGFLTRELNKTTFNKGLWSFKSYVETSIADDENVFSIGLYIYKANGTIIPIVNSIETILESNTDIQEITSEYVQTTDITTEATDSLLILYTYTGTGICSLYLQGNENTSRLITPFISSHNDLSGLQGGNDNERYHIPLSVYEDVINAKNYITISASGIVEYPSYVKMDFFKIETIEE